MSLNKSRRRILCPAADYIRDSVPAKWRKVVSPHRLLAAHEGKFFHRTGTRPVIDSFQHDYAKKGVLT
jgi:hypothetical protein